MLTWLKGKKTYIVVGIGLILTILNNYAGIAVPGFTPDPDWLKHSLELLGIGTLRAAVGGVKEDTSK